jgi:hypothetical protein
MDRPQVRYRRWAVHGHCSHCNPNASGILIDATTPWTQSGRVYVTANQNATGRINNICATHQPHILILYFIMTTLFFENAGILLRVSETWQQSGVATILAQGLSAIGSYFPLHLVNPYPYFSPFSLLLTRISLRSFHQD